MRNFVQIRIYDLLCRIRTCSKPLVRFSWAISSCNWKKLNYEKRKVPCLEVTMRMYMRSNEIFNCLFPWTIDCLNKSSACQWIDWKSTKIVHTYLPCAIVSNYINKSSNPTTESLIVCHHHINNIWLFDTVIESDSGRIVASWMQNMRNVESEVFSSGLFQLFWVHVNRQHPKLGTSARAASRHFQQFWHAANNIKKIEWERPTRINENFKAKSCKVLWFYAACVFMCNFMTCCLLVYFHIFSILTQHHLIFNISLCFVRLSSDPWASHWHKEETGKVFLMFRATLSWESS